VAHCPHSDKALGLNESISRRDFLDGMLVTSAAVAVGAAGPFAMGAQSPQGFPAAWAGYSGEGDYKDSAGNTEAMVGNAHSVRDGVFDEEPTNCVDGKPAARGALRDGPFGRIAFSHSDLSGAMDDRNAFIESHRAVSQLLDGVLT